MSWLSDFVGPRLREIVGAEHEDEDLGTCRGCGFAFSPERLQADLGICPRCGHVNPLRPEQRFAALFDDGRYEAVADPETTSDVLKFRDARRYTDRLKEAQARTAGRDSLAVGRGTAAGNDVVAACVDPAFLGGSLGVQAGAALARAARLATLQHAPLIVFAGPDALRAQEGLLAPAQACRVLPALRDLAKVGMPVITVVVAGHAASTLPLVAAFGDIVIREVPAGPEEPAGREAPGNPQAPAGHKVPAHPEAPAGHEVPANPEALAGREVLAGHAHPGDSPVMVGDLLVPRRELTPVLHRLVDLTVNRRAPAPVFSLHPAGAEPGQDPAAEVRPGADVVGHAADH